MAVPPRLPNLAPEDMKWLRWATEELTKVSGTQRTIGTNIQAAQQQAATAHTAVSSVVEKTAAQEAINPSMPVGVPQVPSAPTLATDHGTVTIYWDGLVHGNMPDGSVGALMEPAIGFNHVSAYRGDSQTGPWAAVGGYIRKDGSVVDVDVKVGTTYWYYLITTDNAKFDSAPSALASITVKGVDLGSLDEDVKQALADAQDAAAAGADAAAAGQAAANAASTAANSAAMQAALALQNANGAVTAANGKNRIIYSTTAPVVQSSDGDNGDGTWSRTDFVDNGDGTWTATSNVTDNGDGTWTASSVTSGGVSGNYTDGDLWLQLDTTGVVVAQWQYNGTAWVSQILSGGIIGAGINAGNITTGTISANRIGANSISASQMITGTITAASGILANAVVGTAQIADLAVNTAKIADLAVNNAKINDLNGNKITAATIVAGKLAADAVTTNNIVAGAIDTNRLAAGAITADKLSLGVNVPQGSSTDRVPQPLTNSAYWASVIAGTTKISAAGGNVAYVASANGIVAPNPGSGTQPFWITNTFTLPTSRRVSVVSEGTFTGVNGSGQVVLRWSHAGTIDGYQIMQAPGAYTFLAPAGSTAYDVFIETKSPGTGGGMFSAVHVTEVIGGTENSGQAAQLSASGLQLFDANGQLAVDLTTNASQYLSIVDNTGAEPQTVAAIDQSGNGAFERVSTDNGFDIQGVLLTDLTNQLSLFNSTPNGSTWAANTPLFDRLARGVVYDVTWQSLNDRVIPAGYASFRIAQDSFVLEDGRQYMFNLQSGGLQMVNPGNANMYLELQVSTTPITNITTGVNISRGLVPTNATASFVTQAPIFTAALGAALNNQQRTMPAGVPIYWQLDVSGASAANDWKLSEFGYSRGLSIIDVGANSINRPGNGADNLPDVSNFVNIVANGSAPAGNGSTGTTATSKTTTFYAKDTKTWNQGGSGTVSGGGQWSNPNVMYYGHGASDMGSWMGQFRDSSGRSLNSVVGGKSITSATLTLKNNYTYSNSGATVQLGTGSMDLAPGSIGAPASNVFSATFAKGATKTITLNSGIRSDLSSGAARSFVLGVSGSTTNYSYFAGASQSGPPKLTVTYH